ncbi:MAG: hypothetical protein U1F52_06175 [Burkholderiales bacterium]
MNRPAGQWRRRLSLLLEVLDWWRLYVAILAAFVAAGLAVWFVPSLPVSEWIAVAFVLVGVVAGVLWQASRRR